MKRILTLVVIAVALCCVIALVLRSHKRDRSVRYYRTDFDMYLSGIAPRLGKETTEKQATKGGDQYVHAFYEGDALVKAEVRDTEKVFWTVDIVYDDEGRVEQMNEAFHRLQRSGQLRRRCTPLRRDAAGRVTQVQLDEVFIDGQGSTTGQRQQHAAYSYDQMGRIATCVVTRRGRVFRQYIFSYDAHDRLVLDAVFTGTGQAADEFLVQLKPHSVHVGLTLDEMFMPQRGPFGHIP